MKAGLTGYAQITGKYNTTPKDKLVMDMMYIEQFSILKDIQLIFQTAIVLLKSDSTEAFDKKARHCPYKFVSWEEENGRKRTLHRSVFSSFIYILKKSLVLSIIIVYYILGISKTAKNNDKRGNEENHVQKKT